MRFKAVVPRNGAYKRVARLPTYLLTHDTRGWAGILKGLPTAEMFHAMAAFGRKHQLATHDGTAAIASHCCGRQHKASAAMASISAERGLARAEILTIPFHRAETRSAVSDRNRPILRDRSHADRQDGLYAGLMRVRPCLAASTHGPSLGILSSLTIPCRPYRRPD